MATADVNEVSVSAAPTVPAVARRELEVNKLFRLVMKHEASDLHLKAGQPPMMRLRGDIVRVNMPPLSGEDMEKLLLPLLKPKHRTILDEEGGVDFSHVIGQDEARFRVSLFKQRGKLSLVARRVNSHIPSFKELGLPDSIESLCHFPDGMIIFAGVTGSGKSTSIAAMLDYIAEREPLHILTIEDPIEFVHPVKKCKITQREVHRDTHSFKAALRSSMRQDPDIILVGEMRDYETISLAIAAAEMGILVFGTLHTNSAAKTIDRIINVFPSDERDKARGALAASTKGIVAQQLCPTKDGKGRCAAVEVLCFEKSLPNLIRTGKVSGLNSLIELNAKVGMQTMDQCLMKFLEAGKITAEQAYLKANEKKRFQPLMEKEAADAKAEAQRVAAS